MSGCIINSSANKRGKNITCIISRTTGSIWHRAVAVGTAEKRILHR